MHAASPVSFGSGTVLVLSLARHWPGERQFLARSSSGTGVGSEVSNHGKCSFFRLYALSACQLWRVKIPVQCLARRESKRDPSRLPKRLSLLGAAALAHETCWPVPTAPSIDRLQRGRLEQRRSNVARIADIPRPAGRGRNEGDWACPRVSGPTCPTSIRLMAGCGRPARRKLRPRECRRRL